MAKPGILGVILIVLFTSSCSDEIQLSGEGDPFPVVYAILDAADTAHYLRLGKSFADEYSVQELLTKHNLYYSSPDISLKHLSSGLEFHFEETEEIEKLPGYFPQSINPVYRLNQVLTPGDYLLRIKPDNQTSAIEERIKLFNDLLIYYPGKNSKRIYFYDDPVTFIWSPSKYVSTYELAFTLEYLEVDVNNKSKLKEITYSRTINTEELEWMQDRWKFRLYSDPFFGTIGRSIKKGDQIQYRKPSRLILKISAADAELSQFIKQNNPDTKVEINYKGNLTNAIGIAAAKYTVVLSKLQLSPKAMDSLRSGRFTKDLLFVNNPDW